MVSLDLFHVIQISIFLVEIRQQFCYSALSKAHRLGVGQISVLVQRVVVQGGAVDVVVCRGKPPSGGVPGLRDLVRGEVEGFSLFILEPLVCSGSRVWQIRRMLLGESCLGPNRDIGMREIGDLSVYIGSHPVLGAYPEVLEGLEEVIDVLGSKKPVKGIEIAGNKLSGPPDGQVVFRCESRVRAEGISRNLRAMVRNEIDRYNDLLPTADPKCLIHRLYIDGPALEHDRLRVAVDLDLFFVQVCHVVA